MSKSPDKPTSLSEKVDHVLTEARLVLPGAQALLGFQLATVLTSAFDGLSATGKAVHVISLLCVTLTAILLMSPAAYHRIVERGEDTERFHRFASLVLLAGMVALACSVSCGLYVVVEKVARSSAFALAVAAVALCFFLGLWFGLTFYVRAQRQRPGNC